MNQELVVTTAACLSGVSDIQNGPAPIARAVPMDCRGRMVACSDDSINTELAIDPAAPVFQGHYPQFPIFPGIYLIETALQAIECFVQMHSRGSVRMTGLKSARLLAPVRPGDLLHCQARLLDPAFCADASQWEVVCSVDGAAVAKLRMTVRTQ